MDLIIFLIIIFLSLFIIYGFYRILNKQGLNYAKVILSLLGYLLSFKITNILKMNVNLGVPLIISTYTCLYMMLIKYGSKNIKKTFMMTFYSNIIFGILIIVLTYYIPSLTDIMSINIKNSFEYNYKILLLYPFIILLGDYIINKIYEYVTLVQSNVFVTIMLSYIISSVIYIIVFYLIAYTNILSLRDSLYLGITSYIIGILVTILNIIFIYLLTRKKVKK